MVNVDNKPKGSDSEKSKNVERDVMGSVDTALGVPGKIGEFYTSARGLFNNVVHRKDLKLTKDIIEMESNQKESPIKYKFSYTEVELDIKYPEDISLEEFLAVESEREELGHVGFVNQMYDSMGINGFEDVLKIEDNPSFDIRDDGFSYTDDRGYLYHVEYTDYTSALSSDLIYFEGLTADPEFEGLGTSFPKKDLPNSFEMDDEAIMNSASLETSKYTGAMMLVRELRDEVMTYEGDYKYDRTKIVPDSMAMIIETLPRKYDLDSIKDKENYDTKELMDNSKLTKYRVPLDAQSTTRFFIDMRNIHEKLGPPKPVQSKNIHDPHKSPEAVNMRAMIHTTVKQVKNGIDKVSGYDIINESEKDSSEQLTYGEIKNLSKGKTPYVNESVFSAFEVVDLGSSRGKEQGDATVKSGISKMVDMFTDKQKSESKNNVQKAADVASAKDSERNRKLHAELNAKHELKSQKVVESDRSDKIVDINDAEIDDSDDLSFG